MLRCAPLCLLPLLFSSPLLASPPTEDGFAAIFDGKTLEGWEGAPGLWTVEDGAITGQSTAEKPLKGNTFIVYRKGEPGDFELRLKYRIFAGNSGIQYRSVEVKPFVISGYQADVDFTNKYTGILYEEKGRGILALRGQAVEISPDGKKKVVGKLIDDDSEFVALLGSGDSGNGAGDNKDGWNDYRIVAQGNQLLHEINGQVTMKLVDHQQEKRREKGLIALQLHAGPPMKVQFKDLRLKVLE